MYGRGYRQPGIGFGPPVTPDVIKQLLIVNFVVFVAQQLRPGLTEIFAVRPLMVWQQGYLWQPVHVHVAARIARPPRDEPALALDVRLAARDGLGREALPALLPGVRRGGGLPDREAGPISPTRSASAAPRAWLSITLGASGAIYGVLLAYSLTWPDRTIMLIFPPVAFRAIWLIPGLFLMTLLMDPGGNVSHVGHLGGVLVGWLYLRRSGHADSVITISQLKHRWRRYRMRQRLRAVRDDEFEARRRRDHDRTLH